MKLTKQQKIEKIKSLPIGQFKRLVNLYNDEGEYVIIHDSEKNPQSSELLLELDLLTNEDHTDYPHIHVYEPKREFYRIMEEIM